MRYEDLTNEMLLCDGLGVYEGVTAGMLRCNYYLCVTGRVFLHSYCPSLAYKPCYIYHVICMCVSDTRHS